MAGIFVHEIYYRRRLAAFLLAGRFFATFLAAFLLAGRFFATFLAAGLFFAAFLFRAGIILSPPFISMVE
ncbi:MAG: hypothetical protein HUU49_03150 [Candidatus Buchananbacteria bacterium]|nr:hypothetical protein [Candidatus Buchananbacteria bacterium]